MLCGLINMGSLRGIGMVVLQMVRVFTVITLAALAASCWVLIVKVGKDKAYFVFECASLFFTFVIALVLMVSEFPVMSIVRSYFRSTWPVLSDAHGVGWLGVAMVMLGCNMLGNLNRPAYDPDNMGPHFSKLVLASSVLALTFGGLNIICALVWRDAKEGVTSRDIRANGSLADNRRQSLPSYSPSPSSARAEKTRSKFLSFLAKGDAPGEKKPSRPVISDPISAHQDLERGAVDNVYDHGPHYDHNGHEPADETANDRRSPIVPGLKRPDTALHPMHTGRSSRYSAATMGRFWGRND